MKAFRRHLAILWFALAGSGAGVAQGQSAPIPMAPARIPVRVLVQGPADTSTELQIVCLFRSDPANTLHGSLIQISEKLNGLLNAIWKPALFRGELGETILIAPGAGTIPAKKLLIIGLGESETFTPERMELVGSVAYREANRLGAAHPFFASTVMDGGVTRYTPGQVAEQVVGGFLRAQATEKVLKLASRSAGVSIEDLTYLAGPQYAASTQEGIDKAMAAPPANR